MCPCLHWNLSHLLSTKRVRKRHNNSLYLEPSLLNVKPFGGMSDFSNSLFQIHIFFVWKSEKILSYCATRGKKFLLQVWSLMLKQSGGNNHTSKINIFPVSQMIFFSTRGSETEFYAPFGANNSTLWSARRKMY